MPKIIDTPELLAPAGNLECAIAAFDSGADAVYAGLPRFNAREKSDNFSFTDLSKLSAYGLKHKKKIYLTLNTLVKERELEEIFNTLTEISKLGIDAVIVQDIGIVRLIRDFFPEISIHASTQMGIHNSTGVILAEKLGISRVILERQVTIEELKIISTKSNLEIEIFIHGALCSSLSGNCLFSSWIGGWSGNRGKCKQPCRRRYHSAQGENGFFFSANDLFTIDLIPDLKKAGAVSFKIEGRLKKADYVSRTVSAYRMVLDAEEGKEKEITGRAKVILAGAAGRKWSGGFYSEEGLKTVIQHTSSGVSGSLSGEVLETNERGFYVKVSRTLKEGDRIRVQSRSADEGPGITLSTMEKNGKRTKKADHGEKVFITANRKVYQGDLVYKVGETPRKISVNLEELPLKPIITQFNLAIDLNKKGIAVTFINFPKVPAWTKSLSFQSARGKGITPGDIEKVFRATRNNEIKAGKMNISINGSLFIPSSTLKSLRREFWQWIIQNRGTLFKVENSNRKVNDFIEKHFSTHFMVLKKPVYGTKTTYMVNENSKFPGRIDQGDSKGSGDIISEDIFSKNFSGEEAFLPVFTAENDLGLLMEKIERAYKKGIKKFRVRSLYQVEILRKYTDIEITAAYSLPVSNSFASRELKDHGVTKVQSWIELDKKGVTDLIEFSPLEVEIYRKGRPHIFVTRAAIHTEGKITDSHGVSFIVKKAENENLTYIYGEKAMAIPKQAGISSCFDLTNMDLSEESTFDFNYSKEWV